MVSLLVLIDLATGASASQFQRRQSDGLRFAEPNAASVDLYIELDVSQAEIMQTVQKILQEDFGGKIPESRPPGRSKDIPYDCGAPTQALFAHFNQIFSESVSVSHSLPFNCILLSLSVSFKV